MSFGRMGAGFSGLGRVGAGEFSLPSFMAGQSAGLYYDFTKLDRHFQENTGPTPADGAGELIGLALDQRLWGGQTLAGVLAAASELVTNGTFDSDITGWSLGTSSGGTIAWNTDRLTATRTAGTTAAIQAKSVIAGKLYRFAARIRRVSGTGAGALTIRDGADAAGAAILSVSGSITSASYVETFCYYLAGSTTTVYLHCGVGIAASVVDFDDVSFKLVPGIPAIQATGTLKPAWQALGAKGDGSDDNLLTSYLAASGANFLGVRDTTVPATLGATQVILGASGSGANRCFVGVDTSGRACGGVGSDSTTTIVGTTDLRDTVADIFLTFNGTTVRLIVNGVVEYEAAQNSTPTTSIPFRLFANNNNGTAGSFYAGYVPNGFLVGREFISAATAKNLGR